MKKSMTILLLLFTILLILPAISSAQGMGQMEIDFLMSQRWWANEEVSNELNLSEEQIEELDSLFLEYHRKINELRANVQTTRFEIKYLMQQEEFDMEALETAIDEAVEALKQLEKFEIMMRVKMLNVLNYEQRVKLLAYIKSVMRKRRRGK
jgi:Spy/CpxP family protein refolding chaperone